MVMGTQLVVNKFDDLFFYWSDWGLVLTLIALIGIIKSSGATR